jgi:hypothetical protein
MSRISNLDYLRKVVSGTVTATDQCPFNFPFPFSHYADSRIQVG